ncbi:MAG: thiamine pyrophosphate-binding protein [Betaproteobacteria bacterium]|nr:thiamine pyrophosphate-binding protein [Betaproteobacteria bacterium]
MSDRTPRITVGELVAAFLERCGVRAAFGVISIHNMPILDAFGRRAAAAQADGQPAPIRFVPARSEPGAVNMADACARVAGGIGVAVTSTGTAAGNACGAMVEALTAGTPLVHLTGQIEVPYLDRGLAYIHEATDQLEMLRAVSKVAFRVRSPETALGTLREAVRVALTAPRGPVSVEIPIDIQAAEIARPESLEPASVAVPQPRGEELDALAERLARSKRPLLWLGGGARHATDAVLRLIDLGFGVVTSVQGRGVVAEDHPMSLGAFNLHEPVEKFYASCDAMLVAGSRLRSNETLTYKLKLPHPLYRVDADPQQQGRCYSDDLFVAGDSAAALSGLAERLKGRLKPDPAFARDLAAARDAAEKLVRAGLGPYERLLAELQQAAGRDYVWVRDVTVSNSTWGNRSLRIFGPRDGVHALGGGIGQGVQMAIGAAIAEAIPAGASPAARGRKTLCLVGDGGLQVNIGELATLVQEKADVTVILMNDGGYGVIRNIQDACYGGRRYYSDLHTPDFGTLACSLALPHHRVRDLAHVGDALRDAFAQRGPMLIEIDMTAIGPFAKQFAGPPVRKVAA